MIRIKHHVPTAVLQYLPTRMRHTNACGLHAPCLQGAALCLLQFALNYVTNCCMLSNSARMLHACMRTWTRSLCLCMHMLGELDFCPERRCGEHDYEGLIAKRSRA